MKKSVIFRSSMLLLFVSFSLEAQVNIAGLLNSTEGTVYFITLPIYEEEYQSLIRTPESFKALLARYFSDLRPIPSGSLYQNLPIYQQDTLVTGYMQRAGRLEHPLFSIIIQGGQNGAYYEIRDDNFLYDENAELLGFSIIADGLPTLNSHLVDGRIIDWLHIPDGLSFGPGFTPLRIVRGGGSAARTIPLAETLFWGRGGTFLNAMSTSWEEDRLYFMVRSFDEISEGLSIFFYFYEERTEPNLYTIEVPVVEKSGPVLLWRNNTDFVEIVGSYLHGDFFVEFLIEKGLMPDKIQRVLEGRGVGSFDLISGFSDKRRVEDFLFGTIPISILRE